MRAVVLGLILINVLYWTWSGNINSQPAQVARALDPDLPGLELVARTGDEELDVSSMEPLLVSRVGSDDVVAVDNPDTAGDGQDGDTVVATRAESAVPDGSTAAVGAPDTAETTDIEGAQAALPTPESPLVEQNLLARVDPVSNPARCVGVGPFLSLRQASEAAARLNEAGLTTSQRVEEAQVWVGHWVHLPSYPTREAAIEVVERLREQGVRDIYIEPSGELKNTVSLGLFTELERAEIRAGKVRQLGDVSPQIRNRSRDGLVYWIDLSLDAGMQLDTTSLPKNSSQELRIETIECPAVSTSG